MDSFYTLKHLLISKGDYNSQPKASQNNNGLGIIEIEPNAQTVRYWVEQVGAPYGWHEREQYTLEAIEDLLTTSGIRLFMLQKDGCPIGYCLTHDETESSLRPHFTKAGHNIAPDANVSRIEGFGLAANQTRKDLGNFYIQAMLKILFKHSGADYVYLTSRSTNHPGVIPFYQNNGMQVIDQEQKREDRPIASMPQVA